MAKESFYFPHDYNSRNDRKIAALVKKHKSSGYGIFWITCEMLHEEGGVMEFDEITFGAIAKDANEDLELIRTVINDCISEFKLFEIKEGVARSCRVSRNLERRQEISKSRAIAGKHGANVKQMQANAEQKEAKERKEKKEKKEYRGISFDENHENVIFTDGTKQILGLTQQRRFKEGDYKPHYIKKGEIE